MTGLSLTSTDDFGQTIKTEYNDPLLRPTRVRGVNVVIQITETAYDDNNFSVKVRKQIDGNNWDESITYADSLGRTIRTKVKDSQGDVVQRTKYDLMGHVIEKSNPYRINASGNPVETIYWSKTRYDELGRTVQSFAPALENTTGDSIAVTLYDLAVAGDSIGTVIETTDAAGRKNRAITNAMGQLIRVDEPSSTNTLDPLPAPSATPTPTPTPDPSPTPQCVINCPNNNLVNAPYPMHSTYYKYDALGKMVMVTQGVQKRYFKYDSFGRLIRFKQPEQETNASLYLADDYNTEGAWSAGFVYDVFGNVQRATDANGVNIISEYDRASRLIRRCYTKPGVVTTATECSQVSASDLSTTTPPVENFYDGKGLSQAQAANYAKGKLTKVISSISETRYTSFDNLGRLLQSEQITDGKTYASKYEYNLSGALVRETYPSGRTVKNTFESDGDLALIQSRVASTVPFRNYASDFSYTAGGRISQIKLGNGLWETAQINTRQQVTELALGTSLTDTSLWKLNYFYGELEGDGTTVNPAKNSGNIAKQTISFSGLSQPFVQTYRYDSLERLIEARETNGNQQTWKQDFGYDRYGNRTDFSQVIGQTSLPIDKFTHPTINPLTNRFNAGQDYIYDKSGNLTKDAHHRQFSFNGDNRQTEVRDGNGAIVGRYFYDGLGKRVKKQVFAPGNGQPAEETIFVYDGMGNLIAEYSTQPPPANPTTNYTMTDTLGSPRVITDALGRVTSRRDFMPFGEDLNPDPTYRTLELKYGAVDTVRQRFTGYQKDTETGLDFAEARYYNNQHARFTAVDPLLASGKSANPQTFNRYVYVMNRPLILTDASGLQASQKKQTIYFRHDPETDITNYRNYYTPGFQKYTGKPQEFDGMDGNRWRVTPNSLTIIGKTPQAPTTMLQFGPNDNPEGYYRYRVEQGFNETARQIREFIYQYSPDYCKAQVSAPLFPSIGVTGSKDFRLYGTGGVSRWIGDYREFLKDIRNFNFLSGRPKSIGLKLQASFTCGYFLDNFTPDERHNTISGTDISGAINLGTPWANIGLSKSLPLFGGPRPAFEFGIGPNTGISTSTSEEIRFGENNEMDFKQWMDDYNRRRLASYNFRTGQ